MARADREQLFAWVKAGDAGEIRAERDAETARLFGSSNTGTPNTDSLSTVLAAAAPHSPNSGADVGHPANAVLADASYGRQSTGQ